jgi:SPP1 gp7 family putative phage head morphogenesis protein
MANASTKIADKLAEHQLELLRVSASKARSVYSLLQDLETKLVRLLRGKDLSQSGKQRLNGVLASAREESAAAYADIRTLHRGQLRKLVGLEVEITDSIINDTVDAAIFDRVLPTSTLDSLVSSVLVQGAPSAEWWSRQAGDTAFRFAQEMRQGVAAGETNAQLISRVIGKKGSPGIMEASRRNAEALVRTSVLQASNDARLAVYKRNGDVLRGLMQISTLDDRTSDICIAYDGAIWNLDGEPIDGTNLPFNGGPPRHWNCRSVLSPVTKSWQEMGIKAKELSTGARAALDGEVPAETKFGDWLERRSQAEQDRILGKGKAELWRSGKISLSQLVDMRGKPLTLDQLESKYARRVKRRG